MPVSLHVAPADHVFFLSTPSFLVDDISLTLIHAESEPMFLSLCIMSARSLPCRKLYGLHKRWHISPGIICKWTDPLLTSYHYNCDFATTAWGNFCTSFQTKGTSVLLTSHCGKQFVTFHKNDLKRHQQLFLRRLLGGYVPAQQLEAKWHNIHCKTPFSSQENMEQIKKWTKLETNTKLEEESSLFPSILFFSIPTLGAHLQKSTKSSWLWHKMTGH